MVVSCNCEYVFAAAAGMQSAVAAVSPMLLQHPGSIPPEMLAMEQQRRTTPQTPQQQHMTSLGSRVRAAVSSLVALCVCVCQCNNEVSNVDSAFSALTLLVGSFDP